jgi:hypothetical protein
MKLFGACFLLFAFFFALCAVPLQIALLILGQVLPLAGPLEFAIGDQALSSTVWLGLALSLGQAVGYFCFECLAFTSGLEL